MSEYFPLVMYAYTDRFTLSLFELASKELIPSFEMVFVASHEELVQKIRNSPIQPDLILLDVDPENLSELEKLKQKKLNSDIPYIFLSSHENEEVLHWAKEFRAFSILNKPGNLASMKLIIEVVNIFTM